MSESASVIGIDLGTSNCAVARAALDGEAVEVLPVPQCVRPGAVEALSTLASSAFLPLPDEFGEGDFGLAWREDAGFVVGAFARERGPLAPDRQISSAKSWLCHAQADRRGAILPWNSQAPVQKVSPLEVSARLLRHLRESTAQALNGEAPAKCVLTIPASFDEAARALTLEAAESAGLADVLLLEEPQAAFYAWIANNPDSWREQVGPGDLVLVCDVGGGTADFSLIAVADDGSGNLTLERLSVGEHILLGGDNLDLALAHAMKANAEAEGATLDAWQFLALTHAARQAKETLFSRPDLEEVPVSIAGRGSSLFASTVNLTLTRELLRAIALDGFLPLTEPGDMPLKGSRAGLRQFGLPYASDPVISKHLAAFLARSREAIASHSEHAALLGEARLGHESGLLIPTAILFNGGFFKADPLRERVEALLAGWNEGKALKTLTGGEPDLAVAMGAAAFARQVVRGEGLRIKSATTRSYYLGLESGGMAIPGFTPPVQAVCVAPLGLEEGSRVLLSDREFGLVVGEPAEFRLFRSATRGGDVLGDVVDRAGEKLEETSGIEITLPVEAGLEAGQVVPVHMEVLLSDVGALELRMRHARGGHAWKLEFSTRAD
ncbi:MAG: Hsp70 family protein [Verrucomicrobia bacterium]|nr:Hsp70 family protein [Verrucomicrobiota bacterium]MCH8527355.1 Hsp70 family protein [Kiritimatiellia bacterium]